MTRTTKRYIVIGLSVYVIELLIITLATHIGFSVVVSVALSYWLGLLLSFGLQKIVTFGDRRLHHKVLLPQILAYGLLVLFNFMFTIVATKVLENVLPAFAIRTLALGVTTLWNYYIYKQRIFRHNDFPIVD